MKENFDAFFDELIKHEGGFTDDAPDDVTQWQLLLAYLKGELETLPSSDMKPSRPSAEQIDRADLILHLWHHHALARKGERAD